MTHTAGAVPAAPGPARDITSRQAAGWVARAHAYLALTKPRIVELLLVTTLPTMFLAAGGLPPVLLIVGTLCGGALVAGSANAINCYIDRDIDQWMSRTADRPLPRGLISPSRALAFALVLGAGGTVLLALVANLQSALLADAALLFYVLVYTLVLKRRSPSNIVIGGAAGCFPVLVGWSAVTGKIGWPAVALFAVVFCWTPPHFWSLALKYRNDYATVGVPMLPVVADARVVAGRMLGYSYAMVAASLALVPAAGWLYGAGAAAIGFLFLLQVHRLQHQVRAGKSRGAIGLFHASIRYLTVLFAIVAVTALLP